MFLQLSLIYYYAIHYSWFAFFDFQLNIFFIMKRRTFIRSIGALSTMAGISPVMAWNNEQAVAPHFNHLQVFSLKEFEDEHEEYPTLVTNHQGQSWMFSLRRLSFPEDKELISAFRLKGNTWEEIKPISKEAGQYEYPTAVCAPQGFPVIAWTSYKNNQWTVEASVGSKSGFEESTIFQPESGKYINPVLFASSENRTWLAWEKLQGKFSICIIKHEGGQWSEVAEISSEGNSLFDPALSEDTAGDLSLLLMALPTVFIRILR